MYAVVGCRECSALWVVADRPETTGCPRCGRRHRFSRLRRLAETESEEAAREARTRLLAERSGHSDAVDEFGRFSTLAERAEAAGVTDAEYLAGSGVDVDEVERAGERAGRGVGAGKRSRLAVVEAAVDELDAPTEDEVVSAAAEAGVPEEAARELLRRMVRRGEATENDGRYRRL